MRTLWNEPERTEIVQRLGRLTPESRAAWGKFTAPAMVAHLVDALRMAFGELPTKSKNLPLRYPPLKQLIIYWLPFPRGAPTAPELLSRPAAEWEIEVARCRDLVQRFAKESRERDWPVHPAFGRLTTAQWGILAYRHTDHHLRQFGV